MKRTVPLDLNGVTELPPGKIATVVTFLEIASPPAEPPSKPPAASLIVRKVERPPVDWYRNLFRRVGEPWLWFSRTLMSDGELEAILASPATALHVLERDGEAIGFAELDRSHSHEVKIAFFGVVGEATGTGAAQFLMADVLRHAFAEGARRVWLHTCTIDHPAAIRFYLRSGFRAYKVAVEVADDPRLKGYLPLKAARHLPVIRP